MNPPGEPLVAVMDRIRDAARRAGRDPGTIRLVAVSKQQPAAAIRRVALAGQREFGESYLQEAIPKIESLADLDLTWHFIGRLQGNKTRAVAEHFSWVHTIDRARIADRLNEQRPSSLPPLNACIQVQMTPEPQKGGIPPGEVAALAKHILTLPRLALRGLMCIPPAGSPQAVQRDFAALAGLAGQLRDTGIAIDTLSMGMSGDLELAIAAGSTLVRVGTAIFGERV
jgi:pyridoxal phosphate enzyme (YggS family)